MSSEPVRAANAGQRFAWAVVAVFLTLFVALVLAIALAPGWLAAPVWAGVTWAGVTWGHAMVLVLHFAPVIAAWLYISMGAPPAE